MLFRDFSLGRQIVAVHVSNNALFCSSLINTNGGMYNQQVVIHERLMRISSHHTRKGSIVSCDFVADSFPKGCAVPTQKTRKEKRAGREGRQSCLIKILLKVGPSHPHMGESIPVCQGDCASILVRLQSTRRALTPIHGGRVAAAHPPWQHQPELWRWSSLHRKQILPFHR